MINKDDKNKANIGIILPGDNSWLGGNIHTYNLISSFQFLSSDKRPSIHLFYPRKISPDFVNLFREFSYVNLIEREKSVRIAKIPIFLNILLNKILYVFFKKYWFEKVAKLYKLSVIYPSLGLSSDKFIAISCIYDLQHKFYPKYFSKMEIVRRDEYLNTISNAKQIVVISDSVKKDYLKFFPKELDKITVIHTPTYLSIKYVFYSKEATKIVKKYNLPAKFYYCGNKFWRHKNHLLILKTLTILKDKDEKINFVFTGDYKDKIQRNYVAEILNYINKNNLGDQVFLLGVIPRIEQLLLMWLSIAIVQPSKFEGWGATVSEGIKLGKKVILSDISAHREFKYSKLYYFDIEDKKKFIKIIRDIWYHKSQRTIVCSKKDSLREISEFKKIALDFLRMVEN